ncbi:MAG: tetraacyldisaccharide 4'-kinase [Ignavibacteriae bacterium HGW-Ignavibacteriae-4]|nr:MAG: tetraacyldisaccharide 4'-kinase [Ignavibacteriae bacterium HGW-Ignavibacteriae-4]
MKLLSYIFVLITRVRNLLYNRRIITSYKSNSYVISIGNIIAGGTGKTPMIIYLAKLLESEGYKVGIVAGGYRRKSKGLLVVHDVDKILTTVDKAGDEAYMIAKEVGCPLVVHDKKYLALIEIDKLFDIDIVLIDDGFQHRKIYRDLDIVIVNDKTVEEENLIPAGYLREEKKNLQRADIILYRDLIQEIESIKDKVNFRFTSKIKTERIIKDNAIVVTAIANPSNFINFLNENNAIIEKVFSFKDHHYFTESEIDGIVTYCNSKKIEFIYTTQKDFVKLKEYQLVLIKNNITLLVIELEILLNNENEFRNYIISKINEKNITY